MSPNKLHLLSLMHLLAPKHLVSGLSVRARIVTITLIPVLGFLASSVAYVAGERDVERALESVRQATALADASREFKTAVTSIQAAARIFAVNPRSTYLQALGEAQAAASSQFAVIFKLSAEFPRDNLAAIERTLVRLNGNLVELKKEYERLDADDDTGVRARLRQSGGSVERIFSLDLSWLNLEAERAMVESLLSMRRHEAAYILDRSFDDRKRFTEEVGKFDAILDAGSRGTCPEGTRAPERARILRGLRELAGDGSRDRQPRRRHRFGFRDS